MKAKAPKRPRGHLTTITITNNTTFCNTTFFQPTKSSSPSTVPPLYTTLPTRIPTVSSDTLLAYVDDTKAQEYLDIWYGEGNALVNTELVAEFKESSAYIYDFGTAVSYKLSSELRLYG